MWLFPIIPLTVSQNIKVNVAVSYYTANDEPEYQGKCCCFHYIANGKTEYEGTLCYYLQ
jgi:hypothetical protein